MRRAYMMAILGFVALNKVSDTSAAAQTFNIGAGSNFSADITATNAQVNFQVLANGNVRVLFFNLGLSLDAAGTQAINVVPNPAPVGPVPVTGSVTVSGSDEFSTQVISPGTAILVPGPDGRFDDGLDNDGSFDPTVDGLALNLVGSTGVSVDLSSLTVNDSVVLSLGFLGNVNIPATATITPRATLSNVVFTATSVTPIFDSELPTFFDGSISHSLLGPSAENVGATAAAAVIGEVTLDVTLELDVSAVVAGSSVFDDVITLTLPGLALSDLELPLLPVPVSQIDDADLLSDLYDDGVLDLSVIGALIGVLGDLELDLAELGSLTETIDPTSLPGPVGTTINITSGSLLASFSGTLGFSNIAVNLVGETNENIFNVSNAVPEVGSLTLSTLGGLGLIAASVIRRRRAIA